MTWSTLQLTVTDHVAEVQLCRPDALNTMNKAFWDEIIEVFAAIDADPRVRCVVLTSTGRHFTAGIDLNDFGQIMMEASQGEAGRVRERLRRMVLGMQESFNAVERCRVPVIAAVQGGCIGGGVDLVTACDFRYCAADAFFRIQEINIGITADVGTLQRLPKVIADGLARELAYTGRKLLADEALSCGLVNRVFDGAESLRAGALETAAAIAQRSPLAIVGTKEVLLHARDHSVADGLRYVAAWQAGMLLNADVTEQMMANLERRPAAFDDLLE